MAKNHKGRDTGRQAAKYPSVYEGTAFAGPRLLILPFHEAVFVFRRLIGNMASGFHVQIGGADDKVADAGAINWCHDLPSKSRPKIYRQSGNVRPSDAEDRCCSSQSDENQSNYYDG